MNFFLHTFADGAAAWPSSLPEPRSFVSLGWLLVGLAALAVTSNQFFALWKNLRPRAAAGGNVGRVELDERIDAVEAKLELAQADLENQVKEVRSYVHGEVHRVGDELNHLRASGESGREGIQNRINVLMELVHHMRGQWETMLLHQSNTADSARRAAAAAEQAVNQIQRHLPALAAVTSPA